MAGVDQGPMEYLSERVRAKVQSLLGPGRMVRGLLLVLRPEAIIVDATLEYS
jgi:hypothetical protein